MTDHDDEMDEGHETDDPATTAHQRASSGRSNGTRTRSHHAKGAQAGVGNSNEGPPNAENAPWSDNAADVIANEIFGEEHPRCLKAYGKTPYDINIEIRRQGEGGQSVVLATIQGSEIDGANGATPGETLREAVIRRVHLVSGRGPMMYDVWFNWKRPARPYGKGKMYLQSTEEIVAIQNAAQNAARAQPQYQPQPLPPPPAQPVGYGAPAVHYPPPPPQQPYSSEPQGSPWPRQRDRDDGDLRAQVGRLEGALGQVLQYIQGEQQKRANEGQQPAPPPQQQGFAGQPQYAPPPPYGRRDDVDDRIEEELADLRDELRAVRQENHRLRTGVGSPPAQPPHFREPAPAPPRQPPQTQRTPDGPNGEIWVEGVGWTIPVGRIKAGMGGAGGAPPQAAPTPAPAPEPQRAAPVQTPTGVGSGPQNPQSPIHVLAQAVRQYARDGEELRRVVRDVGNSIGIDVGLGSEGGAEEAAPETPEGPEDILPFKTQVVEGAQLLGHPVHYAADKETGGISWPGLLFANPGVAEKLVEAVGVGARAIETFAKRASVNTGAAQIGVGAAQEQQVQQAQVVNDVPTDARPADGSGAGSFPRL
jgi:hypothetical protein